MSFKQFLSEDEMNASKYCFKNGTMTPEQFRDTYNISHSAYPNYFKLRKGKVIITDAYRKKCNMDMFESYNIDSVKEKLPKVKIMFDGEEYTGYIRTGDTKFAYVHIKQDPAAKFQYDWETIVDAVNNGTVLET